MMLSLAVTVPLLGLLSVAVTVAGDGSALGLRAHRSPWRPQAEVSVTGRHSARRLATTIMGTRITLYGSFLLPSILTAPTDSGTCLSVPARSSKARKATIQWNARRAMVKPTVMCTVLQLHFSNGCADGSQMMQVEVPGGTASASASFFNYTKTTST